MGVKSGGSCEVGVGDAVLIPSGGVLGGVGVKSGESGAGG